MHSKISLLLQRCTLTDKKLFKINFSEKEPLV